ncbi:GNAT family N-acetyltransferase [Curtobacterium sp. ISL-83]|uniref:GNAT family N-acetyltransferase n=1 Tax=Curtobacterium sp. ISL-83 TaxID=2819145 RepID=UPI001BE94394|nr:GNAT family N-acetyltransferase [Curtobacterium sp. ISL-83]MBT2504180.1 GNAT family N-acetyltransferase [Curtobacterium sp. ISL-83]
MRITVRPALLDDVPGLARVHVESWRETYRGLFPDEMLDDPGFIERRERFWTKALTSEQDRPTARIAAAVSDGGVVGVAMASNPQGEDATWTQQLYILYTYAAVHGRGGGSALLDAVLDPDQPAALWVANPNPRAQAFYRKHGFTPDGRTKTEDGIEEIRMTRSGRNE